jgi:hypothetical protein
VEKLDLALTVDASNRLSFNGTPLVSNSLTSAHILVGNGSNVATDVAMSGDVAITNAGVTTVNNVQSGVITNAMVNASAAIAYSKLNLSASIVNADVAVGAAIAYSKLNLATSIVNADINASAAIAYSKLNLALSVVNADISTSAAIARSKIAVGTADHVIINDGSGNLSSVAQLTIPKGGTGAATFTAYGVVTGGTTTTGALQSVAVGSSGQVLTSNGAGALPSFQNVAGTGTVNSGTQYQLAYYATSTNAVSGASSITTDASGNLTITKATPKLTLSDGANTNGGYIRLDTNTNAQQMYAGLENSAGGTLLTGSSAYAVVVGGFGNFPLQLGTSNAVQFTITGSGDVAMKSLKKFYLDGIAATGDTYIYEASANNPVIVCGGAAAIDISTTQISIEPGHNFIIPSTKKLLVDGSGSGDTYLLESSANVMDFYTGGAKALSLTASSQVDVGNTKLTIGGNQAYPILQIVRGTTTTITVTASATFVDTSCTVTITPKFTTSKILIFTSGVLYNDNAGGNGVATIANGTTNLLDPTWGGCLSVNAQFNFAAMQAYDSPGSTSAQTYKVRVRRQAAGNTNFGQSETQVITAIEIAQ